MFNKLKQVKDLRDKAKQIQNKLAEVTVEGSGSWGKAKVIMDGNQSVKSVTIDDELLSDKAKLESGIKDAFNDAVKKVQKKMVETMKESGDLNFPGM